MIATLLSLLTLSVISSDASYQFSFCVLEFQASVTSSYYRGLNNFPILFSGFLIIIIVQWAPKPYSNH